VPDITPRHAGGQIVGELEVPVARAEKAADERHPEVPQRAVVERVASAATGVLQVGHQALGRIRERRNGLVEESGLQRPPHDVAVAEPARQPRRAAACHHDVAPGLVQLLGDLEARLPCTDDQHAAVRQRVRSPVSRDVELVERLGQSIRERAMGTLERARGEHDPPRGQLAA
jgi:hypothetical protein